MRQLGLERAEDPAIYGAARTAGAVILTKDQDFVELVYREGAPPQVMWVTCGNTSNERLREILAVTLPGALGVA